MVRQGEGRERKRLSGGEIASARRAKASHPHESRSPKRSPSSSTSLVGLSVVSPSLFETVSSSLSSRSIRRHMSLVTPAANPGPSRAGGEPSVRKIRRLRTLRRRRIRPARPRTPRPGSPGTRTPSESAPVESPGGELGDVRRAVRVEPSAPRRRRAREEVAPTRRARRTARRVRPRRKRKPAAAGVVVIRYRPDSSRSHRVSPPVALLLSSRGRGAPSRVSREGREEFLARVGDERVGVGQRGRRVRDRSPILC